MHPYILWLLIGWGLSSWVLMRVFWLPDPPPDWLGRYVTVTVLGIAGAMAGGYAVSLVISDPMPGIFGAAAAALIPIGLFRGLSGRAAAAHA
jgi:hypothetical protein